MKTVKFILPVVAIMVAVAGVFATENSAPAVTLRDVTALQVSPCTQEGTCDTDETTFSCELANGTKLYRIQSGACTNPISVGKFEAN